MLLITIFFAIILYGFYRYSKKKSLIIFSIVILFLFFFKSSLLSLIILLIIFGVSFLLYKIKEQKNRYIVENKDINIDQALEILGLKNDATQQEIKEAYLNLIRKLHPDKGGNLFLANQVIKAYKLLTNSK